MKTIISLLIAALFIVVGFSMFSKITEAPTQNVENIPVPEDVQTHIESKTNLIRIDSPLPNDTIDSPLTISGEARGYWFFEASFPIILTDWDGKIIAEHYATAAGEWMTEDFVRFVAELDFESPYKVGDPEFMRRGTLILRKDNPSGLSENDDALEIPVLFSAPDAGTYKGAIDAAERAADLLEGANISLSSESVFVYDGITMPIDSKTLDLSGRNLSGSLKAEIGKLKSLEVLDISNNNFTAIPAEVGQLPNLRVLNVSHNPITGLPYEIGNLQNLEQFDLIGTNYSKLDLEKIEESLSSDVVIFVD